MKAFVFALVALLAASTHAAPTGCYIKPVLTPNAQASGQTADPNSNSIPAPSVMQSPLQNQTGTAQSAAASQQNTNQQQDAGAVTTQQPANSQFPAGATDVTATFYGQNMGCQTVDQCIGSGAPFPPFGLGACGNKFIAQNQLHFVAIDSSRYNQGLCGMCVQLTSRTTGKTTIGPVVDECPTCNGGIDISLPMMTELANGDLAAAKTLGVMQVDYQFVSCPSGLGTVAIGN